MNLKLFIIIVGMVMLPGLQLYAQNIHKIEGILNVKEALRLKHLQAFGIKGNASGGKAEVRMYYKPAYKPGNRNLGLIYGVYSQSNSPGTFVANSWTIQGERSWLCVITPWFCSDSPTWQSNDYRTAVVQGSKPVFDPETLFVWTDKTFEVVIELELHGSTQPTAIKEINLPGIAPLHATDFTDQITLLADIYEHPDSYPNYVMLAAHRGYWKDAPENSLEAFQSAVYLGVDMVEIDLKMTADGHVMVAHDFHLGRLTTLPKALKHPSFQSNGRYLITKMKLCDIRPDLEACQDCAGCKTPGVENSEPVQLIRPNGETGEEIPLLRDAFELLKGKVLINLDKIDPGTGGQVKTYFFDSIYQIAQEAGVLKQVVVKQRLDKISLAELQASSVVDWSKWYYTPTAFPDMSIPDFQSTIGEYFNADEFNCPGVELIYLNDSGPLYPDVYNFIRDSKKRVIQFPQYPENSEGVWNPKQYVFSDIDPSNDRRNDWNWLLEKPRRPDLIISDRLEILLKLLQDLGLREL